MRIGSVGKEALKWGYVLSTFSPDSSGREWLTNDLTERYREVHSIGVVIQGI